MKRKLTSLAMAIVLIVSLSIPALAADERQGGCPDDWSALVWQLLRRHGGCNGEQECTPDDWSALLRLFLTQQAPRAETPTQPEMPTRPAKPTQNGGPSAQQPTKPQDPTQSDTPNAQQPSKPEKPTQNGKSDAQPETPAQTETQQPAQAGTSSAYEQEVARLVNAEREKEGLAPLTVDASLTRTARMKSQDMHDNGYFDHQSPTYGSPFDLMKAQGIRYRTAGENIAMGYRTPEAVVSAWMNSPGHRANILNASYTKIGVGYVASGNYWTQHFTG